MIRRDEGSRYWDRVRVRRERGVGWLVILSGCRGCTSRRIHLGVLRLRR